MKCLVGGCLKCDNSTGKCATCNTGFFLLTNGNNVECRACNVAGCDQCAENSTKTGLKCIKCKAGYLIRNAGTDNPTCESCNVQNCADCSAGIDSCAKCTERFVLWDEAIKNEASGAL